MPLHFNFKFGKNVKKTDPEKNNTSITKQQVTEKRICPIYM